MKKTVFTLLLIKCIHASAAIDNSPVIMPERHETTGALHTKHQTDTKGIRGLTKLVHPPIPTGAERMHALLELQKEFKNECMKLDEKHMHETFQLLKKHQFQLFDLGIQEVGSLNRLIRWNQDDKDVFFDAQVSKARALHKQQANEWKELWDQNARDARRIYEHTQKQLSDFEKRINAQ